QLESPEQAAERATGAATPAPPQAPDMTVAVDEGGDIAVPDFKGKTMREVADTCVRLGLNPVLVGSSLATQQVPATGSKVRRGAKVTVQFGMPPLHPGKTH